MMESDDQWESTENPTTKMARKYPAATSLYISTIESSSSSYPGNNTYSTWLYTRNRSDNNVSTTRWSVNVSNSVYNTTGPYRTTRNASGYNSTETSTGQMPGKIRKKRVKRGVQRESTESTTESSNPPQDTSITSECTTTCTCSNATIRDIQYELKYARLTLSAFLPIHTTPPGGRFCSKLQVKQGIEPLMAFKYAVERVNKNKALLGDIDLG